MNTLIIVKCGRMKYLILFILVISIPSLAQSKKNDVNANVKIQTTELMAKICSDAELREAMIEMILDSSKGSREEMTKFGKIIMDNPEMNSIIAGMVQRKTNSDNGLIQSLTVTSDSTKTMKTADYKLSTSK
jgi:hypothetical protein